MTQTILHVALVVRDYDEAIAFFTNVLDFTLVEVFKDLYGNSWDLVEAKGGHHSQVR